MSLISDQELRKISTGSDGVYIFDFSVIDAKYYNNFFRSLSKFSLDNVITIGFSCDHYHSLPRKSRKTNKIYLKSISHQEPDYLNGCISFLQRLFKKSSIIEHLILSNLSLSSEQLQTLGTSINISSLQILEIKGINLTNQHHKHKANDSQTNDSQTNDSTISTNTDSINNDITGDTSDNTPDNTTDNTTDNHDDNQSLPGLFSTLNSNSINKLILRHCGITNKNYTLIIKWIQSANTAQNALKSGYKGLETVSISPSLTPDKIDQIKSVIESMQLNLDEEEEETKFESLTFESNQTPIAGEEEEYFEKHNSPKKMTNEEMIEYNKQLRKKVNTLRQLIGIKSLEKGNMFLVGEGSTAFSKFLLSLQQKLANIPNA